MIVGDMDRIERLLSGHKAGRRDKFEDCLHEPQRGPDRRTVQDEVAIRRAAEADVGFSTAKQRLDGFSTKTIID